MSLAPARPDYGLWHYVWKLLRLGWLISFNTLRRAKLNHKIGYLAGALVALAVAAGVFAASWAILAFLRSPALARFVDPALFLPGVPALILTGAFVSTLLFSFGVLLQALYLANDLDFLLSAPVPIRAVFVAKLLQAILPNFGLVSLFCLPLLYGLGAAEGYHILYYPLVVVVLAVLALVAAGLASLLVMGVVRVFPARRVAEVLGLLTGLISFLCTQLSFFSRSARFSRAQMSQVLDALAYLNAPWSPLAWAGRGLADIGEGRWLTGAGSLLLTVGLASAIFVVTLSTAERLYYTGWARLQGGTRRKKAARVSRPGTEKTVPLASLVDRVVPSAVRGLIVKDALVIRRDLRNMSQLLIPLIVGVIYTMTLIQSGGRPPAGRGEAPAWFMQAFRNVLVYGNVGISLFVTWSLTSRLAMMGFSQEGRHYWLLKTAPISAGRLLAAKFMVAYLPALALGWGFLLAISLMQGADLFALLFGMSVVALCSSGIAGINLAFGVAAANLEWGDPRQMVRRTAGCAGTLAGAGYMIVTLALFFGPLIGFALLGWSETAAQFVSLIAGGAASLACAIVPLWLVYDRVPRIGEM